MLRSVYAAERSPLSASGSAVITPNDNSDLVNPATNQNEVALALYCEGAGNVAFIGADGNADTWPVTANFVIPVAVTRVKATGTTVGVIHAIF
jgi:hypothetical protein